MNLDNINVADYLSEEDIASACRLALENHIGNEQDIHRIIDNHAYKIVYKMIDEVIEGKLEDLLRDKVLEIINNLNEFHVFKKPDAWDRGSNHPHRVLYDVVRENRDAVSKAVKVNMNESVKKALDGGVDKFISKAVKEMIIDGMER